MWWLIVWTFAGSYQPAWAVRAFGAGRRGHA